MKGILSKPFLWHLKTTPNIYRTKDIINGIRATPRVFLNDSRANLIRMLSLVKGVIIIVIP